MRWALEVMVWRTQDTARPPLYALLCIRKLLDTCRYGIPVCQLNAAVDLALRTKLSGCVRALKRALPAPLCLCKPGSPGENTSVAPADQERKRRQVGPRSMRVYMSCAVAGHPVLCFTQQHAPGRIDATFSLLAVYRGHAHLAFLQRCAYRYRAFPHARVCAPACASVHGQSARGASMLERQ